MNRAEYIELIDLLERRLRDAEGLDINDPSLYAERDPESGELRRRHPRDHVVAYRSDSMPCLTCAPPEIG